MLLIAIFAYDIRDSVYAIRGLAVGLMFEAMCIGQLIARVSTLSFSSCALAVAGALTALYFFSVGGQLLRGVPKRKRPREEERQVEEPRALSLIHIFLERTNGEVDVDVGGLYRSLRRLEDEGAVASRWCDEDVGPRRREYELTQQGVELAEQWLDALRARRRLDDLLVELLEGGLAELKRNDV